MAKWQASFISAAGFDPGSGENPAAYFRAEFSVAGLRRARLHVTALGLVEPWLNGVRVGDEVLAPGWTSYHHRLAVTTHDVTDLISDGTNALGLILGEGWAVGRVGWEGRRAVWADRPSVFAQLEIDDDLGARSISTDAGWRTATGAVLANSLFDGESFDARLDPRGWCEVGFDDAMWSNAVIGDGDLAALVPRTWEPIRAVEELAAREVIVTPAGRTVVDFGQNISGWVRLRVKGPGGTTIRLRHAETLIHGEIDFETNRKAAATDTYVLAGAPGGEAWEPRFTFHGFRYVDVEGWPGPLDPADLTAIVVHSDMRRTGWFESSHSGLDQLHRNVVWSMRDNFVGVPTDCPQRDERAGWTGDINAFGSTAAFLYDVRSILGSWLEDLALDQKTEGSVPFVVPNVRLKESVPTALWGDVAVNLPWVLYEEYGDVEILRQQYESMTAFVDQVEGLLDEHGLWSTGYQLGDWLDPDAPASNPSAGKTDAHLIASAFFCRTTRQMARTAAVLGHEQKAQRYARLDERVRAAFRREWITPAGRLANETQTAYALIICFNLLEADQFERAGQRLATLVAESGHTIATGFAGTPFVLHALTITGHLSTAYQLLLQEQSPSFLYPVNMGATTTWERWDAIQPDGSLSRTGMTSLNHYALGAFADWLHRVVGGLSADSPGYATLRVAPRPGGGLASATVVKDTPHGRASVSWVDANGLRTVKVTVPDGVSAEVVLPDHPVDLTTTVRGGAHEWAYAPVAQTEVPMDLLTPVKALRHMEVWKDVVHVFHKHFPTLAGAGEDFDIAMFGQTLLEIVQLTGAGESARQDLIDVLAAAHS